MTDRIRTLWHEMSRQMQMMRALVLSITHPASAVVPVQPQAGVQDGTQLLMYHDQLPPMQRITLGGTEQDGHYLDLDWVYTCVPQPQGGSLWMTGEPGLFMLGAKRWRTDQAAADEELRYALTAITPAGVESTVALRGSQHATLFLERGARLYLTYRYLLGESPASHQEVELLAPSEFVLTRVSRMPSYAAPEEAPM